MSSAIPVIIGMILRIPVLLIQGKRLNVKTYKLPILAVVFTIYELFGTMVLYIIENGALSHRW